MNQIRKHSKILFTKFISILETKRKQDGDRLHQQ